MRRLLASDFMTKTSPPITPVAAASSAEIRVLHVHAYLRCAANLAYVDRGDLAAVGIYEVTVPASLDDDKAACCAMDGFHSTVPVKSLDDLELEVWDLKQGLKLLRDEGIDDYDLAEQVILVRRARFQ